MIDKTVNEIDYDSLAEDECDGAQQNVIELKMRQMRSGLQKNQDVLVKQRDTNRISSSQELLKKAKGW